MNNTDNKGDYEEEADPPRLVVCDLGEMNWIKAGPDLILVNRTYVFQIEKNRRD